MKNPSDFQPATLEGIEGLSKIAAKMADKYIKFNICLELQPTESCKNTKLWFSGSKSDIQFQNDLLYLIFGPPKLKSLQYPSNIDHKGKMMAPNTNFGL